MSAPVLGFVLGIFNVIVNMFLFALFTRNASDAGFVVVYGTIPGMLAGFMIGTIAGLMQHSSPIVRWLVLSTLSSLAVLALGAFFDMETFVPIALAPTLAFATLLERRTRAPALEDALVAPTEMELLESLSPARRDPIRVAMVLGAVVMAILIAGVSKGQRGWFELYLFIGLPVGTALAAPFGHLATVTRDQPVWARQFGLLGIGFVLCLLGGLATGLHHMIGWSFVPVAVGCLVLERYSRPVVQVPRAVIAR